MPLTLVLAAVLLAFGTAASGGSFGGRAKAGYQTIRYQTSPGEVDPLELGSYLGYLPGIPIKSVGVVLGGPAAIQGVATGAADIGTSFWGTVTAAIGRGAHLVGVLGSYGSDRQEYEGLYVNSKSPIHSAKDLIGKNVGVNTLGANATVFTDLWLAKQGLTPAQIKKVGFVAVSPTAAAEALSSGRIDAAELSPDNIKPVLAKGTVRLINPKATDIGTLGPYTGGGYVLNTAFVKSHPAEAKELVTGLARTIHWLQVTPRAKAIRVQLKVLEQHGRGSDAKFVKSWLSAGVAEPYGYIKPADFTRWIPPELVGGELTKGKVPPLSKLYTNQYNAYAPK
ncbi:MAG: ABC transporter substrate-binding protein [Solirubrobacterales bacterium]|nr:ABC transporter substrate-binding protein [Solirubrobacterales bacterium]